MKNNPFIPWGVPPVLMDRKEEQKIILNFLEQVDKKQSWLLLIRGSEGMGKGTLLNWAKNNAEGKKLLVCFIKAHRYKTMENFLEELKIEISNRAKESEIVGVIKKGTTDNFIKEKFTSIKEFIKKTKEITKNQPLVFIVAEYENLKHSQKILEDIGEVIAFFEGMGVIISSIKKLSPPLGSMVIELKQVSEQDYREYIEKMTKNTIKMGDECLKIVYKESGGCPKLLQFITWYLYDNARETDRLITQAHYTVARRSIISMLAKEWFANLYYTTSEAEKKVLKELATVEEMNVTELAKTLGWKEGPTATILLRLVEKGNVVKVKRGTYRIFAPLYKAFILER